MMQPHLPVESNLPDISSVKQGRFDVESMIKTKKLQNEWLEQATGSIRLRERDFVSLNHPSEGFKRAAA